jgi:hypothetical protein
VERKTRRVPTHEFLLFLPDGYRAYSSIKGNGAEEVVGAENKQDSKEEIRRRESWGI